MASILTSPRRIVLVVCEENLHPDLRAGYNAGVRFNVGVLSGAHSRDVLAAEPHTHLLASVADLPTLLADASPGAAPDGEGMTGFRNP